MGVSAFLSGRGAWLGAEGGAFILLIIITAVSEPSKIMAYRVLLGVVRRPGFWNRVLALIWCVACIGAAGYLSRLPVAKSLAEAEATVTRQEAQQAAGEREAVATLERLRAEQRAVEMALEEARSGLVPGIRKANVLRAIPRERLSREEKLQLDRELNSAQLNDQLEAKIERLTTRAEQFKKDILKSTAEHSRTFTGHPKNARVSDVRGIHEQVNALALAAAILVEVGILGGIWHDVLARRGEAPAPVPATLEKGGSGRRRDSAKRFETWLRREWQAKRGKDGWLEGTQQGWARTGGFSPGFVYAQLEAMQKAGRIEKRADHKNTWVIFRKVGELKTAT